MKKIYATYANDCVIEITQSIKNMLNNTEEAFVESEFNKGYKKIEIYDDVLEETLFSLNRKIIKENIYSINYITRFSFGKNGSVTKKTQKRQIFIFANTRDEALAHFMKITNGKCFYFPQRTAENITVEAVEKADGYTPCLIAL